MYLHIHYIDVIYTHTQTNRHRRPELVFGKVEQREIHAIMRSSNKLIAKLDLYSSLIKLKSKRIT